MNRHPRGVTLIELLIVVAILAIMSASLLAVVVAPIREQVITDIRVEQLEGTTILLSRFVEDAHLSGQMELAQDGTVIHFSSRGSTERNIVYKMDDAGIIRRYFNPDDEALRALLDEDTTNGLLYQGTPILAMGKHFQVTQEGDSPLWRLEVVASRNRLHTDHSLRRSIVFRVGDSTGEVLP